MIASQTRRLRTSVLGAALISAFVAGVIGALVIIGGAALGQGAGGLADTPLPMLVMWGIATGPFVALPGGALCGAAVAAYVRRSLLSRGDEGPAPAVAASSGGVLGALHGLGLYYFDPSGPSLALLVFAGTVAGVAAGRIAAAVVISDYRADAEREAA